MRPEYDGVKFYSNYDLSVQWQLEKSEPILNEYSDDMIVEDINKIIELFNIQKLLETGNTLPEWTEEKYNEFKIKGCRINRTIAKFLLQITDDNFIAFNHSAAIGYEDDFWFLFDKFKVYNRVSPETFLQYLQLPDTVLYKILKHKKVVQKYDEQLAQALRTSNQTCRIIVSKFLEKNDKKYYLPNSFKPTEYEGIFQQYIDTIDVSPKILMLIFNAQSTNECPVSDRIRLKAKRKYTDYWEKNKQKTIEIGVGLGMSFTDQDEVKTCIHKGSDFIISYDIKWFEENLDYPTIMNNFYYVFEMFDWCCRSTLVSVKSKIDPFERLFTPNGISFYERGNYFRVGVNISSIQMLMYYDFLQAHGVFLENIFEWFFMEYLMEEFGIDGFVMKKTSATDYAEKCRTLVSEMDGVLKQYRMYVSDGYIDRELFEMSSEHLIIERIPSLIKDKYAYANSDNIQQEMFMLFSDQACLSYTDKTQSKYSTLYNQIKNEKMVIDDYTEYQVNMINWLIERNTLQITDGETIEFNDARVSILKDLYDHDVICVKYLGECESILYEMRDAGDIRIESSLFSEPEKNYLNYELNKAEYSDGLDLRNKYAHSTYPQNENVQRRDYVELLKIMVLIITKINEEFCLSKH